MATPTSSQGTVVRFVLGYDDRCGRCSHIAEGIKDVAGDRLLLMSLRTCDMRAWRSEAFGDDAPWVPTLVEIGTKRARAWVGVGLARQIVLLLGPTKAWRVLQILGGQSGRRPNDNVVPDPQRRALIKGMAGTAIALGVLSGRGASRSAAAADTWSVVPASNATISAINQSNTLDPDSSKLDLYVGNKYPGAAFTLRPQWWTASKNGVVQRSFGLWRYAVNNARGTDKYFLYHTLDAATGTSGSWGLHATSPFTLVSSLYVDSNGQAVEQPVKSSRRAAPVAQTTSAGSFPLTDGLPDAAPLFNSNRGAASGAPLVEAISLQQDDPCTSCQMICGGIGCGLGCAVVTGALTYGTDGLYLAVTGAIWGIDCTGLCASAFCGSDSNFCCASCGGSNCTCQDPFGGGCGGGPSGGGSVGFN